MKVGKPPYRRYEELDARFAEYYGQLWLSLDTQFRRSLLCGTFEVLPASFAHVEATMRSIMKLDRDGADDLPRSSRNQRSIH